MKICAVTAEFNPFHNGHKHFSDEIKKRGFTHTVAVMSGNFVQRGEPAIISKVSRTQAALMNGIDLVVELPCVWAVSTAEKFASAAVRIADSFGCVDTFAFGSECGDINRLKKIAAALCSEEFSACLKNHLSEGVTFAKARESALSEFVLDAQTVEQIKLPNNILGIEYLKAAEKFKSGLKMLTISRTKSDEYVAASEIREMIAKNDIDYKKYIPESSFEIISREIKNFKVPAVPKNAEQAIMYKLREMSGNEILNLPDISEGIENRILNSVKESLSLSKFLLGVKTKRYTMSRIKRIVFSAYLGITAELQNLDVPYIRVLGMTEKGTEILKKAKSNATLPIISKYSDILKMNYDAQKIFNLECRATDLYGFFLPKLYECGKEQSFKIIKDEQIEI